MASSQPPPRAGPSTAAMVGQRWASSRSKSRTLWPRKASSASRASSSLMSAPETNMPGVVECKTRMHRSRAASVRTPWKASMVARSMALRFSGRLKPTRRASPRRSTARGAPGSPEEPGVPEDSERSIGRSAGLAGPGLLGLLGLQAGLELAAADGPHAGVPADHGRVVARGPDGRRRGELLHGLAVAEEDEDGRG